MTMRQVLSAILLVPHVLGCRSTAVSGGVSGGIGHNPCAVMLQVDLKVTDDAGATVSGTEAWLLGPEFPEPAYPRAWRFGLTDSEGRISRLYCYMDTAKYQFWIPEEEPVTLRFLVVREGFGPQRTTLTAPAPDVLTAGGLVVGAPGPEGQRTPLQFRPSEGRAYRFTAAVSLPRATGSDRPR
jgi:hypothetical protein